MEFKPTVSFKLAEYSVRYPYVVIHTKETALGLFEKAALHYSTCAWLLAIVNSAGDVTFVCGQTRLSGRGVLSSGRGMTSLLSAFPRG
jgi:hypothetical protein